MTVTESDPTMEWGRSSEKRHYPTEVQCRKIEVSSKKEEMKKRKEKEEEEEGTKCVHTDRIEMYSVEDEEEEEEEEKW